MNDIQEEKSPKLKLKRIIAILVFNVGTIIFLVVIMELISSRYVDKLGSHALDSELLDHTWKPNSTYVYRDFIRDNPDFPEPFIHVYNAQGWIEEYNVDKIKPANTYRIFFLGDSWIKGNLSMEKSIPSVVESQLNNLANDIDLQFEVINTGVTSYSPLIYYVLLQSVLLDYDPDLIVVAVDMTDDYDDWKYKQTAMFDENGNPTAVPSRKLLDREFLDTLEGTKRANVFEKFKIFIYSNSYTFNLLRTSSLIAPLTRNRPIEKPLLLENGDYYQRWAWCHKKWDQLTEDNVSFTLDILRRLARLSLDNNVKVLFTSVPHYWQYAGEGDGSGDPHCSNRPHDEISAMAAEVDVPYLNGFELLAKKITGTPQDYYYYKNDMHFNPRGYEIWAQTYLDFLLEKSNELLPQSFGSN